MASLFTLETVGHYHDVLRVVSLPISALVTLSLHATHSILGKVNMEHQLDATITVSLISKISSTCFGQTFAHLQERKTEIFTTYGIMSC
jgi:uncharacterized membrane protein YjjB (DUF3815 family)